MFADNVIYGTGDDHVTINKAEDKLTRAAIEETYESIVEPYSYSAHTDQVNTIIQIIIQM